MMKSFGQLNHIKKLNLLGVCLLLILQSAYAQTMEWAKMFGSSGTTNFSIGQTVSYSVSGNCYFAGAFGDSINIGSYHFTADTIQTGNSFVTQIDAAGNLIWAGKFTSCRFVQIEKVLSDDSGNIFIAGTFASNIRYNSSIILTASNSAFEDYFVLKINSARQIVWAKCSLGIVDNIGSSLAIDQLGNLFLAGRFAGEMIIDQDTITSTGEWDGFILKIDPVGNIQHYELVTGLDNEFFDEIKIAEDGSVYAIGTFAYSCSHNPYRIARFDSLILNGNQNLSANNFLIRYNSNLQPQWVKQTAAGFLTLMNNKAYVASTFYPNFTLDNLTFTSLFYQTSVILAYDASGNIVWHKTFGSSSAECRPLGLSSYNGQLFICGTFTGSLLRYSSTTLAVKPGALVNTDYCGFIARLDTLGNFTWVNRFSGGFVYDNMEVAFDGAGSCYVASTTRGAFYFNDPNPLDTALTPFQNSIGQAEATLMKFDWILAVSEAAATDAYNAKVFPNPANESVTIQFDRDIQSNVDVKLIDMNGSIVFSQTLALYENAFRIDVSILPNGLYILKVISGNSDLLSNNRLVVAH